jgi:hypothetical protein
MPDASDRRFPQDATDEPGAIASRCHHLADQLAGGPVRDALLEMARDYTGRALDSARTASFRLELERSQRDATAVRLFEAFDRFIDGVRSVTQPTPAAPRHAASGTTPVAAAATPAPTVSPRRASRLYRIHALQAR